MRYSQGTGWIVPLSLETVRDAWQNYRLVHSPGLTTLLATWAACQEDKTVARHFRVGFTARPGAATKLDQPHRDREGMCAVTMLCVYSPMVATLTPCHKIGCKIVHSVQDFQN